MSVFAVQRADSILGHLSSVQSLRAQQFALPTLRERVHTLKRFQQRRFRHTYADLLASLRFGPAARFFLDELYGPDDFTSRDAQFQRVVPALVRLFPERVIDAVERLVELHALSERLDHEMAGQLTPSPVDASAYWSAWRALGRYGERRRQLDMVLKLGRTLDELTRSRVLRQTLHWMRGPAQAAGLADLQRFLEQGFDAFAAMKGADEFLAEVRQREGELLDALEAPGESLASARLARPALCALG